MIRKINLSDILATGLIFNGAFITYLAVALDITLFWKTIGLIGGITLVFSQTRFLVQKFIR